MKIHLFINDIPNNMSISGNLAIDTEAMGLNLTRDRLCLLQFCQEDNNNNIDDKEVFLVKFEDRKYNCPNLKKILTDNNRVKIFHFARFDLAAINYYLGVTLNNIFCTHVASKLVRTYTDSHGLKDLCREFLGVQISKLCQSSDWGAQNFTSDQEQYAAKDVVYLHRIKNILEKMLIREQRFNIAQKIFQFLPTRAELDIIGWQNIDILSH
ncbi:3'-5' exonuclease family protein [Orientia chuto str. Dubai]|uniref:3'-5' exonuclease family protein n=1 Tax=Orientia chuto str. Dubai TaxID=1359168 RepID=A0A0F3MJ48_9RICK|nr:ribonuclease H-like domain-containing protein [Candidatus Orientia mediorientalis]KJV55507.1 3'-5' exonuclease family protein [Orientia chuto str. Dubai]